jgi:IS5 family transposase
MFRILVLQALYSLSNKQAQFQRRDRRSFMRFACFSLHQGVPDAKLSGSFASSPRRLVPFAGGSRSAGAG